MSCPVTVFAAGTAGLQYELNDDGKSYYVDGYEGTATTVVVPDAYNGKPVTKVGGYAFAWTEVEEVTLPDTIYQINYNAFYRCENLKSVDLGDGLENIQSEAFYYCSSLERVALPASLSSIGDYAFSGCSSVVEYVVNSANQYFSSENGVLFNKSKDRLYKYPAKSSTTTYVIPSTVKNIEQFAFGDCWYIEEVTLSCNPYLNVFYNCPNLKRVNFAEGSTSLGDIFYECPNIQTITLSKTVASLSLSVLRKLLKLSTVVIDAKNSNFCAENNVIFNKTKTELLFYLPGKDGTSYTVPSTVNTISANAFSGTQKLENVVVSENVSAIGTDEYYDEPMLNLGNSSVSSFSVASNNRYYSSIDGVLFTRDKKTLLCYPCNKAGSSYKIPDGTEIIRKYAIYECANLKSVYVPDSIMEIGACGLGYYFNESYWEDKVYSSFVIEGTPGSVAEQYADSCGIKFVDPNHTHSYTSKVTKKATVNSTGVKTYTCSCGDSYTKTIAQLKCSKPKFSKIENTTDGVKITWGKVSGADKYDVYRKTGGSGKYSKIGTTSKTYYTDKKASSGKKYYYYVKAVNEAGCSEASSSKSILYLADTTLSTPKSTKSGITLKWKKVIGAEGYRVYRKTGSGSYSKIATVKGNSKVSYTDKKTNKGKTYTYKIKAYKSKTTSAYSNTKKIKDKY